MLRLLIVSLLWAFSFGLIKRHLVGVDSAVVTTGRLGLALLVFAPFLRLRGLPIRTGLTLVGIGAVQFGIMYLAYIHSFQFLRAYEVALFTITTPIFVTLLADVLDRTLRLRALVAAVLAVIGAALVTMRSSDLAVTIAGLALVQLSNAAFALGQIWYQRLRLSRPALRDRDIFGLLYAGGFLIALTALLGRDVSMELNTAQLSTLVYLGVLASGLGFFLWNQGATQVNAGALAVMNNAKVPLAVIVSLLFFGERAPLGWLAASLVVMVAAVWLAVSSARIAPSR